MFKNLRNTEALFSRESVDFDTGAICGGLCPLKCKATTYSVKESKFQVEDFETFFANYTKLIENKLNLTNITIDNVLENTVTVNIFYDRFKHNKITQTPKTRTLPVSFQILVAPLVLFWT